MSHSQQLLPPDRIPEYAYVAGPDKVITGRQHRDCITAPYVQVNPKDRIFNMILDLDSDDAILDWIDNVPILPAYFVGRKRGGRIVRPHALIKLRIPVDLTKGRQASLYYAIRARIAELLAFGGTELDNTDKVTTKNPNSCHWSTVTGDDRLWTLDELRSALNMPAADELDREDLVKAYSRAGDYFNFENASKGRNCMLFESIRGLAYVYKAQCVSEHQLYEYVLREAIQFDALNNANEPLKPSAIKATSRKITNWTWHTYKGSGQTREINHGACADDIRPEMTLSERQAVGGRYGVQENAKKHENAVREAIADRDEYSIKGLARELSMSVNTIRKYVRMIESEAAQDAPETTPERGVKIVLSGVCKRDCDAGPDLRAVRDGQEWAFWIDPYDPEHYYDEKGDPARVRFVEPYITWRAEIPPAPDIPF